jgi:hypothetical protein
MVTSKRNRSSKHAVLGVAVDRSTGGSGEELAQRIEHRCSSLLELLPVELLVAKAYTTSCGNQFLPLAVTRSRIW